MRRAKSNRTETTRSGSRREPTPPRSTTRNDDRDAPDAEDAFEADLDRELAETFPASDPISRQVPSTIVR